jgi:hypothetical protein
MDKSLLGYQRVWSIHLEEFDDFENADWEPGGWEHGYLIMAPTVEEAIERFYRFLWDNSCAHTSDNGCIISRVQLVSGFGVPGTGEDYPSARAHGARGESNA